MPNIDLTYDKHRSLLGDVKNRGGCASMGAENMWEAYHFPLNFAVKGEVLPQKSLILKKCLKKLESINIMITINSSLTLHLLKES